MGSQVDLLPTMLDSLNISIPSAELYQGVSLYSPIALANRKIYINSFRQYGIVWDGKFICGDRNQASIGSSGRFFSISNQGSRSLFHEINFTNEIKLSISTFNRFQENFLRHYSEYCQRLNNRP
jgi:hypothetical protein